MQTEGGASDAFGCGVEDLGYSHHVACKLTQSQPQLLGMQPWHLKYCNQQIQVPAPVSAHPPTLHPPDPGACLASGTPSDAAATRSRYRPRSQYTLGAPP